MIAQYTRIITIKSTKMFMVQCKAEKHIFDIRVTGFVDSVVMSINDRAIAQALVAGFPQRRSAVGVRSRVKSRGICCGQSGIGAGILRVLRFPLPILIQPTAPYSSSIVRGWYNMPVSSRRTKRTQSHPTPRH
jgi:hypothetical protein